MKTSTILIASDEVEGSFRSVKEVPLPMRAKLIECTRGANSGTILIADEGGREELSRAMRTMQDGGGSSGDQSGTVERFFAWKLAGLALKDWMALVIAIGAVVVAWLLWR